MNYNKMNDEELRRIAGERIRARSEFKSHLTVYILVNAGLWLIYLFAAGKGSSVWPVYPMLGWGIGLVMHYVKFKSVLSGSEQGAIEKEIADMKRGAV